MTAVDKVTSLRQRREAIVMQHAEAENRHDVEATIASFHRPRYEFNGRPSGGEEAVRELLQGFVLWHFRVRRGSPFVREGSSRYGQGAETDWCACRGELSAHANGLAEQLSSRSVAR